MTKTIKHEPMRIAGKKVDAEKNINVHYPYTNEIIGTVIRYKPKRPSKA